METLEQGPILGASRPGQQCEPADYVAVVNRDYGGQLMWAATIESQVCEISSGVLQNLCNILREIRNPYFYIKSTTT